MTCIRQATDQDFADLHMMELAAKAAGLYVMAPYMPHDNIEWLSIVATGKGWSPLHDDGDAVNLGEKLGLRLELDYENNMSVCYLPYQGSNVTFVMEPLTPEGARRAIVRAAVLIGKSIP